MNSQGAGLDGSEVEEAVDELGGQLIATEVMVAAMTTVLVGKEVAAGSRGVIVTVLERKGTDACAVRGDICPRLDD